MAYVPTPIRLSTEEGNILEKLVRSTKTEQRIAQRSRIVLLAAEGLGTNEIARKLDIRAATVSKWRTRFARNGMDEFLMLRDQEVLQGMSRTQN